jgi:hypothetical protein
MDRPRPHDQRITTRDTTPRRATTVAVGLALLATAGCAGPAGPAPAATPARVTTTTIDPVVISAFMQPRITAIPVGTYHNASTPEGAETLVVGEIGASYTELIDSRGQRFQGTLSEDPGAHQVTFTNAAGAPCAHQPGVYRADVAGRVLRLAPVSDPCVSRAADFAAGTWTS